MNRSSAYRQRGAALLLAMLVVTLVASLSASAYWQQWRVWQVEVADQHQQQSAWLLNGALDWARLILREDARSGTVDHLAEPWAVPLQEAQLSTFLGASPERDAATAYQALLSGSVSDLQGRLNLRNLVQDGDKAEVSRDDLVVAQKLFEVLGLPARELNALQAQLPLAWGSKESDGSNADAPLRPQTLEQLAWCGLSPRTLRALAPHATWLPERTTLNINTASAEALYASVAGLDLAQARQIVQQRARQHFKTLDDVRALTPALKSQWTEAMHGTASRYFEVRGLLRLEGLTMQETSVVVRQGVDVRTLWRRRGGLPDSPPVSQ